MSRHAYIVMARVVETGIEIRCGLCASWWPATDEFYRSPSRCIACEGELRHRSRPVNEVPPWDPTWCYRELVQVRDSLPFRAVPRPLRVAVRRAYWREFKRKGRPT